MSELPEREAVHRALADPHRARIVDELDRHQDGLDVQNLAEVLGVHPNTVRWHLGVLADAGLVNTHPGARDTPGRPAIVYTRRDDTNPGSHDDYRLLAMIATGILSELPDADDRAFAAGEAWGRSLIRRPKPGTHLSEDEATQTIVGFLAEKGFRPEAEGRQIRMHHCPFREIVDSGNSIVCSIHRGLICGALAELGSGLELERLDVFVEEQLCIAQIAPRRTISAACWGN